MHFVYDGFTHEGNRRRFLFRGLDQINPESLFSIEVELSLFVQNHVPVQEGPIFCLQLLNTALLAGANHLDRFHNYRVGREDLRPILVERERKAAEHALKKFSRKPFRKPPSGSNIHLEIPGKSKKY